MSTDITLFEEIKHLPCYRRDDAQYLVEHKEHLQKVLVKTHMWRTDVQKRQILNDIHFPTLHAKFHQAILEQKVQFENSLYLAKDFELKKLDIEEIELDLEELSDSKRDDIARRKMQVELKFKQYELQQMHIAMTYRMDEVKGWQALIEELYAEMQREGISDDIIWSKNDGEFTAMFFSALNNAGALDTTTDSAERSNIMASLHFVITQAKSCGLYEKLEAKCSPHQLEILKRIH